MKPHVIPASATYHTYARPNNLNDIVRAMDFVRRLDLLVWKRSGRTSRGEGTPEANLFSEENVKALEDRIQLWERAVRNPIKRTK
jgi:hypothetical protein